MRTSLRRGALPLALLLALPVTAAADAGSGLSSFERLQAKSRSRLFTEMPSPRGEHYVHLDDRHMRSGGDLSPEITVQPETRGVTTVINTFTPSRLNLDGDSASLGTVRLRGAERAPREIEVKTTLNLHQPLRVRVRERARPKN